MLADIYSGTSFSCVCHMFFFSIYYNIAAVVTIWVRDNQIDYISLKTVCSIWTSTCCWPWISEFFVYFAAFWRWANWLDFESNGMQLLKPSYVVLFKVIVWPLWELVQRSASAHILGKWSPLSPILFPFIYLFLSLSHRVSGCVNNESIFGGILWLQMGWRVTGMHGFGSLSAGPCALNNSLTYHFFSWDWEKSLWSTVWLHQIPWLMSLLYI